jgi:hypothetical protein
MSERCLVDTWLLEADGLFGWHCLTHQVDSKPAYATRNAAIEAGKAHLAPAPG